jgi:GNAT superfamily N-acetyltransferase
MLENSSAGYLLACKINSYLKTTAAHGRETGAIGPFVGTVDTASDNPFRNYAIPIHDATPTGENVGALIAWFQQKHRIPRLEFATAAAPDVEAILIRAGFSVEGRLPLMTCQRRNLRVFPCPEGIEIAIAVEMSSLRQAAEVQNQAYEGREATEDDVQRLLRNVASGGSVLLAFEKESGAPAGAGLFSPPASGVTEIAAVGVLPLFRRRGIARALTARLTQHAFEKGIAWPFLMAASEPEERIYSRVGFTTMATILHISLPTSR